MFARCGHMPNAAFFEFKPAPEDNFCYFERQRTQLAVGLIISNGRKRMWLSAQILHSSTIGTCSSV